MVYEFNLKIKGGWGVKPLWEKQQTPQSPGSRLRAKIHWVGAGDWGKGRGDPSQRLATEEERCENTMSPWSRNTNLPKTRPEGLGPPSSSTIRTINSHLLLMGKGMKMTRSRGIQALQKAEKMDKNTLESGLPQAPV